MTSIELKILARWCVNIETICNELGAINGYKPSLTAIRNRLERMGIYKLPYRG